MILFLFQQLMIEITTDVMIELSNNDPPFLVMGCYKLAPLFKTGDDYLQVYYFFIILLGV